MISRRIAMAGIRVQGRTQASTSPLLGRAGRVLLLPALVLVGLLFSSRACLAQTPPAGSTITTSITLDRDLDLTGQNFTGTVWTVGADNVIIDGAGHTVTAPDASYGIFGNGVSFVTIRNLRIIAPASVAIGFQRTGWTIENVTAKAAYGITAYGSNHTITGCSITANQPPGNPHGFGYSYALRDGSNSVISNCRAATETGTVWRIVVSGYSGARIEGNDCSLSAPVYGARGIALDSSSNISIVSNDCRNSGIYAVGSSALITNNNCSGQGISASFDNGTIIRGNDLSYSPLGLWLGGNGPITTDFATSGTGNLNGNMYTGCGTAVNISGSNYVWDADVDFSSQNVGGRFLLVIGYARDAVVRHVRSGAQNGGIYVYAGVNLRIEECDLQGDGLGRAGDDGILVEWGDRNQFVRNNVSGRRSGIFVGATQDTLVKQNVCRNCPSSAISLNWAPYRTTVEENDCSGSRVGVGAQLLYNPREDLGPTIFRNNIVADCTGAIETWGGANTLIEGNRLSRSTVGLILVGTAVSTVNWRAQGNFNGNDFSGCSWMLSLSGANDFIVEDLDFSRFSDPDVAVILNYCYGVTLRRTKGAIRINSSECTIENSDLSGYGGYGLLGEGTVTLNRCIVTGRDVGVSAYSTMINCTVTGNVTGLDRGANMRNCIVWGNGRDIAGTPITVTYSDIGQKLNGEVWPGTGNISQNPMFVGGGDFHLLRGSPCIDKGDPADPVPPGGGSRIDMGAFESAANALPTISVGAPSVTVDEGQAATNALNVSDPDGDSLTVTASIGTVSQNGSEWVWSYSALDGPAFQPVTVTVSDGRGGSAQATFDFTVNNVAPAVEPIVAPLTPMAIGTSVSASAAFADPGILDTHTAAWDWGDGMQSAGTVNETNGSGTASGEHVYTLPGVYTLTLTVTDKDGAVASTTYKYVVVYDPDGGFVTGGGWINSPAGAYEANPALTGRATFGFNAKYRHGNNVPDGQAEFQFRVADLNFHSSSYEWLVVAGARAQFKGVGTINGQGSYRFMITAIDGQRPGGGGYDKFRIRIWGDNGPVYDNQKGTSVDGPLGDGTRLGGGSIVIHEG